MLIDQLQGERYVWSREATETACKLEPGQVPKVSLLPSIYEAPEIIDHESVTSSEPASGATSGWFGIW